ncbi:MAG TPA: polysaccharide biosynthesis/export family protein [Pseudomonadales bacterium]
MNHARIVSGVVALLLACAATLSARAADVPNGPKPGDLVRVTVYGQPDLTTLARVNEDNTISFPFIGQVVVGGVSTAEAQTNIARELDRQGIVRNPQVNVLVETEGSLSGDYVTILGHVRQPGRYPLGEESELATNTLLDLIAVAGGTTETAHSRVVVFRSGGGEGEPERIEVDLEELMQGGNLAETNLELTRGDVVMVPETDVFYIYGQVGRPGRYPLEKNMLVMHAISVGGGVTERGNEGAISVTRLDDGKRRQLNAKLDDPIMPGDVIYVKERFF